MPHCSPRQAKVAAIGAGSTTLSRKPPSDLPICGASGTPRT